MFVSNLTDLNLASFADQARVCLCLMRWPMSPSLNGIPGQGERDSGVNVKTIPG